LGRKKFGSCCYFWASCLELDDGHLFLSCTTTTSGEHQP
jgi:hypothetical protein